MSFLVFTKNTQKSNERTEVETETKFGQGSFFGLHFLFGNSFDSASKISISNPARTSMNAISS